MVGEPWPRPRMGVVHRTPEVSFQVFGMDCPEAA